MLTWIAILLAGSSCLNADTLNFHNGATLHGSFVGADNRTVRFAIGDQVKSLPAGRCRFDSVQRGSCSGIGHTGTRFRAGSLQLRVRPRPAAGRDTNHDPDDRQRGFPPGPARPALPGQHRSTGGGEWTSYRSARSRCSGGGCFLFDGLRLPGRIRTVLSLVGLGEVGIVVSREISRLSRTDKDWCALGRGLSDFWTFDWRSATGL
jgi:hypothetical protein